MALLLVLNSTVAFNGIIFYTNIIKAVGTFQFFIGQNYIIVFIPWLNLEMGIDAY